MSDIFICYSRTDSAVARRLAERLRAEGWSVFLDVQAHVGKRWHKEIEKELHGARAVVALWSAQSRESDFVLEEAEYGKRKEILFPAFIERVEIPYGFSRITTADLVGWAGVPDHPGLAQLLGPLRSQLGGGEAPPVPVPPAAPSQPVAAPRLSPGQTFRDKLKAGGEGPLMVVIPAGRFLMGSPPDEPERKTNEGPQHEVHIAQSFAMGVYAVTFEEYDDFCKRTTREKPKDEAGNRGSRPVIHVSWHDAQAYCDWLSTQMGHTYRLPSEAEWEYACRAGTDTAFHFGASITTAQANFNGNQRYDGSAPGEFRGQTVPVGTFSANAFGLYEMHGNVWEWCQDTWHDTYLGAPADGSAWVSGDQVARLTRGGSWDFGPSHCRAAYRSQFASNNRGNCVGFRVCCSSPIE